MKLLRALGVVGLGALLGGCDQVGSAVDQANAAKDKASACAEATGLANLNPHLDPAELAAQAQQKSDRLRALAGQVTDQDLKQNLITIADSYVSLEQRKINRLSDVNGWLQRNATNLDNLRSACF
jgi:hypothetical protein